MFSLFRLFSSADPIFASLKENAKFFKKLLLLPVLFPTYGLIERGNSK